MWDGAGGSGRAWRLWQQFRCKGMKAWTQVLAVRTDWKRNAWGNFDTRLNKLSQDSVPKRIKMMLRGREIGQRNLFWVWEGEGSEE